MPRHRAHGAVAGEIERIVSKLQTHSEEWIPRRKALEELQKWARAHADDPAAFSKDVCYTLAEPLILQVKDLRSAIVRETCEAIKALSEAAGDRFRPLAYKLLPTLIALGGSGNKVIFGYVYDAVHVILKHTHVARSIPQIVELSAHKSTPVRETCFEYLRTIICNWQTRHMERYVDEIERVVHMGLADASPTARATSRTAFVAFREHWPDRAALLYERQDPRLQRLLDETPAVTIGGIERRQSVMPMMAPSLADDSETGSPLSAGAAPDSPASLPSDSRRSRPRSRSRRSPSSRTSGGAGGAGGGAPRPATAGAAIPTATRRLSIDSHSTASGPTGASPTSEVTWLPELGDRVSVHLKAGDLTGVVRFAGVTDFADGLWVGVELPDATGKNDGSVKGRTYFRCAPGHGLFVKAAQVHPVRRSASPAAVERRNGPGSGGSKRVNGWVGATGRTHQRLATSPVATPPPPSGTAFSGSPSLPPRAFALDSAPRSAEAPSARRTSLGAASTGSRSSRSSRGGSKPDEGSSRGSTRGARTGMSRTQGHKHTGSRRAQVAEDEVFEDLRDDDGGLGSLGLEEAAAAAVARGEALAEMGEELLGLHRVNMDRMLETLREEMQIQTTAEGSGEHWTRQDLLDYIANVEKLVAKREAHARRMKIQLGSFKERLRR